MESEQHPFLGQVVNLLLWTGFNSEHVNLILGLIFTKPEEKKFELLSKIEWEDEPAFGL